VHVVDSRELKGPGILALQDFRPIDVDVRHAILACRVIDRDDMGLLEVEEGTYGDILNAAAWPAKSRPMPAWSWAWSVLAAGSTNSYTSGDPGHSGPGQENGGAAGGTPPQQMIPARGTSSARTADTRFSPLPMGYPADWPGFPLGWSGIAVSGTDEDVQRLHWHPTDPRLVSPHRGVGELSSIVIDCNGVVPGLAARLANHLFVVNAPSIQTSDENGDKVAADMSGYYVYDKTGKKVRVVRYERNPFGFNPPTLKFSQTPGFSASGERLSYKPTKLNGTGDFVYGAADAVSDPGSKNDGGGSDAAGGGAGGGGGANGGAAGSAEAAKQAAWDKAYAAVIAAGGSEDDAALAGAKAWNALGSDAKAWFAPGKAPSDGAGGDSHDAGDAKAGTGNIQSNTLAWLVGHSNGFHGGFVLDNEPPGGGGGGTFTGPNSYTSGDAGHTGPGQETGSNNALAGGTAGLIAGGGGVLTPFGVNPGLQGGIGIPLPKGAGNLARTTITVSPVAASQGANKQGVTQPGVIVQKKWNLGSVIQPRAHSLGSLGIKVGTTDGKKIVAMVSANYGGFMHPGTADDAHNIGKDADGNPINPAHISIDALFYADKNRDGPLAYSGEYRSVTDFELPVAVHMAFDGDTGKWQWYTTTTMDEVIIRMPGASGGPTTPGGRRPPVTTPNRDVAGIGAPDDARDYYAQNRETSFAVILGRPQSLLDHAPDLRSAFGESEAIIAARRAPIVGRIEAFGAQATEDWTRNLGENTLYRGGTGSGGFALMPAESRIDALAPGDTTLSTVWWVMASGARLGFGTPLPSSGGFGSGWTIQLDGSDLLFSTYTAGGTGTSKLRVVDTAGDVILKVLTANKSIQLMDSAANVILEVEGANKLGFHGATPQTKATISGSRADPEGALKNLLAALAARGDFTDSTTA
jgi:hypothetical protein